MARNVGDLGKLIAAKGFKKLPKVQKIAKSGHTAHKLHLTSAAAAVDSCVSVDKGIILLFFTGTVCRSSTPKIQLV